MRPILVTRCFLLLGSLTRLFIFDIVGTFSTFLQGEVPVLTKITEVWRATLTAIKNRLIQWRDSYGANATDITGKPYRRTY